MEKRRKGFLKERCIKILDGEEMGRRFSPDGEEVRRFLPV